MEIRCAGLLPETLVLDLPEIDAQHEKLFCLLEELKVSCFANMLSPSGEFECLFDAMQQHFSTEEYLAAQAGVDFSEHARVHLKNLQGMKSALDLVSSGGSDPYSFLRYVEFWFERHIIRYDKPFAVSLKRVDWH